MRYRHILRDVDRYGNVRLYFRKKKGDPKIRIDVLPSKVDMLIVVPGRLMDEQRLHAELSADHAKGEWFYPTRTVRMTALRSAAFCKPVLAVEGPKVGYGSVPIGVSEEKTTQNQHAA